MADETLRALITGDEQISSVLRDVQDELEDTADAARDAAAGMAGAAASFNAAEEAADDLQDTLGDISGVATAASGALEGTEESTDELRSAAISGAGALQGYQAALDNVPEAAIEAATANQLAASSADEAGDEFRSAARAVEDYRDELATAGAISLAVPDVADRTATIQRRVTTTVNTEGVAESTAALASVREATTAIPDSRTVSVDVDTDTETVTADVVADTSAFEGLALPDLTTTATVTTDGVADARADLASVAESVRDIPRERTVSVDVDADTETVTANVVADTSDIEGLTLPEMATTATVSTDGIADARADLESVAESVRDIPRERTVTVDVDTDTDALQTRIATDTSELQDVALPERQYTIGTDIDTGELTAFREQLDALPSTVSTAVEVDGTAAALTEIEAIDEALDALPDTRRVGVDADTDADIESATVPVTPDTTGFEDLGLPAQTVTVDAAADVDDVSGIDTDAFGGLTETFEAASVESHALSEGLESASDESAHAAAEAAQATSELDALGDASRHTTTNVDSLGASLSDLSNISGLSDIEAVTPTVQTAEARENFDEFAEAISALPGDVRIDDSVTGTDEFAEDLETAQRRTRGAYESLQNLQDTGVDIRGIVGAADGLDDLQEQLEDAGGEAATTARRLDSLSGSARDMTDDAIAGAAGLADLETATDDISRNALTASAALSEMGEETSDLAGDAITTASSMQFLAGRVDAAQDEMVEATAAAGGLQAALMALSGGSIASGLSDISANVGGISASLSSVAKAAAVALPMITSLGAAAGGLSIGALGAGAGLSGLVGAGLYGLGEQVANRDPSDDIETGWDGVSEILGNVKSQIATIFEPLSNNPVFQNLALDVLNEAVQIAAEFATFIQRLAPALGDTANRLMAVFDAARPAIWAELEATTRAFLPVLEQMLTGALQALPGMLRFMREEGAEVIPMIASLTSHLISILPPMAEFGTALLAVTIPALSWLIDVTRPLFPLISALADGMVVASQAAGAFYSAFAPIIDPLATIAIGAIGVAAALSMVSTVIGGVVSVGGVLVGLFASAAGTITTLAGALGTVASIATTVGSAIAGVVAALNPVTLAALALTGVVIGLAAHFGYLDGVINALKGTWDAFAAALTGDFGPLQRGIAKMVNGAIGHLNNFIKELNKIPGVDLGTLGKIDAPQKQAQNQQQTPGPSLGDSARPAGIGGGQSGRGSGGASSPGTSTQTAPYQKQEYNFTFQGDAQNESRIRDMVKEAVREANREERRRTQPTN